MMSEHGTQSRKAILIVDDHQLLRRGLAALIESEPELFVCAEAATCEAALEAIKERMPDLAIVDLELGDRGGLELIKEMKESYPAMPALMLSMHDEEVYAERALRAGARGYVTKQQLDGTVLAAIRCVLEGRMYISEKLGARFVDRFLRGETFATDSPMHGLSDRQLQVFRAIGQGRTTCQIAAALHLSIKTIESHREHIKDKLGIHSSAEMAQRATQWVESGRSSRPGASDLPDGEI